MKNKFNWLRIIKNRPTEGQNEGAEIRLSDFEKQAFPSISIFQFGFLSRAIREKHGIQVGVGAMGNNCILGFTHAHTEDEVATGETMLYSTEENMSPTDRDGNKVARVVLRNSGKIEVKNEKTKIEINENGSIGVVVGGEKEKAKITISEGGDVKISNDIAQINLKSDGSVGVIGGENRNAEIKLEGNGSILLKTSETTSITIAKDGNVIISTSGNINASGKDVALRCSGNANIDAQSVSISGRATIDI